MQAMECPYRPFPHLIKSHKPVDSTRIRPFCKYRIKAHSNDSDHAEHIKITDRFPGPFDPNLITDLRHHFDERYADPLLAKSNRFVWDPWHIPGQYSLLRTPAHSFFPLELYDRLEDALIEYGERKLGCRGISPIWLSLYTDGAHQEIHTDTPHGPWAFVLSLTQWEARKFHGGETTLLQPSILDYWRSFDPARGGMETPQLTTSIAPLFARLTVFDARIPHWVREVHGTRDLREGRLVLHGWFTTPNPFFDGALSEEKITTILNETMDALFDELSRRAVGFGTVTVRLKVGGLSGRVENVEFLTNTLMVCPSVGVSDLIEAREDILECISDALSSMEFESVSEDVCTNITVPLNFG